MDIILVEICFLAKATSNGNNKRNFNGDDVRNGDYNTFWCLKQMP
jgi:hypothetical protein